MGQGHAGRGHAGPGTWGGRSALAVALVAVSLFAASCTDGPDLFGDHAGPVPVADVGRLGEQFEPAEFDVRPSVEQVSVTGAEPGRPPSPVCIPSASQVASPPSSRTWLADGL